MSMTDEMVRAARKRVALDDPGFLLSAEASKALITAVYPAIREQVLAEVRGMMSRRRAELVERHEAMPIPETKNYIDAKIIEVDGFLADLRVLAKKDTTPC